MTDRARGVLLGLACGDALGRPVEGWPAARIEAEYGRLTDMVGHGVHRRPAGTITDDTDMALCIARSLAERGTFDPADIADRFVDWYESGPVGIGGMTRRAIGRLQRGQSWETAGRREWTESPEGRNAGNGSVMRCAPIAVAFVDDVDALARASVDASRITHADPRCTVGSVVLNLTIAATLADADRPLARALDTLAERGPPEGAVPADADGDADTAASFEGGVPPELRAALADVPDGVDATRLPVTGYVVDTLRTALFDALTADDAEAAIVSAVNRGGDTDTIGAVAGAVAGARFGASSLPDRWLDSLEGRAELERLAEELTRL